MFEINFHFARWRIGRTVEERVRKRYLSLPVSALLQFLSPLFHNFSSSLSLSVSSHPSEGIAVDFSRYDTYGEEQKRKRNEREREGGNGGEKKRERGGEMDEQASDEKKKKRKKNGRE